MAKYKWLHLEVEAVSELIVACHAQAYDIEQTNAHLVAHGVLETDENVAESIASAVRLRRLAKAFEECVDVALAFPVVERIVG